MKILHLLFFCLLFSSCKNNQNLKKGDSSKSIKYLNNVLKYVDGIDGDINMDSFYKEYEKQDTVYIISSLVESNIYGKWVAYHKRFYNSNDILNEYNYNFNFKTGDDVFFIIEEYSTIKGNDYIKRSFDTIFFKGNKISFWKNKKNATLKEIRFKEVEILDIKQKIDSILNAKPEKIIIKELNLNEKIDDSSKFKYSNDIIKYLKEIKNSQYLEENGGGTYEKDKNTLFLDILEEMNTHEKIIEHTTSFYKNDIRHDNIYSFFMPKKEIILLVVKSLDIGNKTKKDTFFFKNNKIYFWKNKQASKEELIKKEKEILAIKKEIDSIMEW